MKNPFCLISSFFSLALFIYLIWPFDPKSIDSFSPLPNSVRSKLSGDTVEVKNLTAYFSNHYRDFVIDYYASEYQYFTKLPFPPFIQNYPPEEAFQVIKDQTQSTYLMQIGYPLRGFLFVNGLEPFDKMTKEARYAGATYFVQDGQSFETKVTLRFYPTSLISRLVLWLGINVSVIFLYLIFKKMIIHE